MSNVRLTKTFEIPVIVVSERYNYPVIITYTATAHMVTSTEDTVQQNVAYDRMRFWVQFIMTDSVLIAQDDKRMDAWAKTGCKLMVFPEDPIDQLVGIMLCCKLNAIVEGRISVEEVEISSTLDDDIVYHHAVDEHAGPFAVNGWWLDAKPVSTNDTKVRPRHGKIINIKKSDSWKEYGLDWNQEDVEAQILVADFGNDENK
jgi:hypothetical protein